MASKKKHDKDPEKKVDLPPHGARNPDPITDEAGSHPIETGVGATLGGAAAGAAAGALGGPVGAIVGAVVGGAIVGGLAGKGVGELIDPTTEDYWLREYFQREKRRPADATPDTYRSAYHYGVDAGTRHAGRTWDEVEPELRTGWDQHRGTSALAWDDVRHAVRDAYDRTGRYQADRGGRPNVTVTTVREEVVIDREPVNDPAQKPKM